MMIDQKLKKLIENNALALATTGKDGKPHVIAVGYLKVVSKDEIVITNAMIKKTVENLRLNNNVALAVWSRNWEEDCTGFELIGTAEHFTKGKWKEFVDNMPENEEEKPIGAIVVKVKKIKRLH